MGTTYETKEKKTIGNGLEIFIEEYEKHNYRLDKFNKYNEQSYNDNNNWKRKFTKYIIICDNERVFNKERRK